MYLKRRHESAEPMKQTTQLNVCGLRLELWHYSDLGQSCTLTSCCIHVLTIDQPRNIVTFVLFWPLNNLFNKSNWMKTISSTLALTVIHLRVWILNVGGKLWEHIKTCGVWFGIASCQPWVSVVDRGMKRRRRTNGYCKHYICGIQTQTQWYGATEWREIKHALMKRVT